MRERGWGRIVNIASIAGKDGNPNLSAYSATKAAVIGLTKSLGKELALDGVLVNAIAPAVIDTEMNAKTAPDVLAHITSLIPMRRIGRPDEVAELVAWLASDRLHVLDRRGLRPQRWPRDLLELPGRGPRVAASDSLKRALRAPRGASRTSGRPVGLPHPRYHVRRASRESVALGGKTLDARERALYGHAGRNIRYRFYHRGARARLAYFYRTSAPVATTTVAGWSSWPDALSPSLQRHATRLCVSTS